MEKRKNEFEFPNSRLGIDIGSTTVKVVVLNQSGEVLFSDYRRHFANIQKTAADILTQAKSACPEIEFSPSIT